MRREKTKPDKWISVVGPTTKAAQENARFGGDARLHTTPECATKQREHSWLESLEFCAWTWIA